jgi:hypothetical protein
VFFNIDPKKKEKIFLGAKLLKKLLKPQNSKKQNTASTSVAATFVLLAKFRQEQKFKILH